jgi:hypothetical protein
MRKDIKETSAARQIASREHHHRRCRRGFSGLCIIQPVKRIAKWLAISILVLVVLIGAVAARRYRLKEREGEKREAEYDLARRKYAAALQPGITRKEVEDYLRRNNVVIFYRSSDDLVKIGKEDPPWFCNDMNVYVAFQFDSSKWTQNASDILTAVSVTRWADKCL